jgi:hypothetical protein
MLQENLEIIRRGYDAWNRDMNAVLDQFSSDATLYPLEDFADSLIRCDRGELRRLFAELRDPWERDEVEANELVDAGGLCGCGSPVEWCREGDRRRDRDENRD